MTRQAGQNPGQDPGKSRSSRALVTDMNDAASLMLPSQYEPVWLAKRENCVDRAIAMLANGADEGVLVVAPLHGPDATGNLDVALTLHPEIESSRYGELALVAALSLGQSIAGTTSPMVSMLYGWPDRVLLNDLTVARIRLIPVSHPGPRLVLQVSVYISHYPEEQQDAGCLKLVDTGCVAEADDVLGLFSRHFLHWINHWNDAGFAAVLRPWEQRIDKGYGEAMQFTLGEDVVTGKVDGVEKDGALRLRIADNGVRQLSLSAYFGLAP